MQAKNDDWNFRIGQGTVLVLTFFNYCALHACRQAFANAKDSMHDHWNFDKHMEGAMDAIFLFCYAAGLYISGMTGDKFNAVRVHASGLVLTGVVVAIFGASVPIFHIHSHYIGYYFFLWALNGFTQSTGWPTAIKLMGNWFDKSHSGFIFGLWSANACAGNILGAGMVSIVLTQNWNIEWMFWLPAINVTFVGFLGLVLLREKPNPVPNQALLQKLFDTNATTNTNTLQNQNNIGTLPTTTTTTIAVQNNSNLSTSNTHLFNQDDLQQTVTHSFLPANAENETTETHDINIQENSSTPTPPEHVPLKPKTSNDEQMQNSINATNQKQEDNNTSARRSITFLEALRIPTVIVYALCYACLKAVNYAMFFWLPFYLDTSFGQNEANQLSMLYNVGQIFGSWICGWISDSIRKRSPPLFLFLFLSILPTIMLRTQITSTLYIGSICTAAGFLIGGPANMISGAIAADLGKHKSVRGSAEALSTVSGIMDGTASLGAAIMQYLVAVVSDAGWEYVFIMLGFALVLSTLLITPLFLREMKELCQHGIQRRLSE